MVKTENRIEKNEDIIKIIENILEIELNLTEFFNDCAKIWRNHSNFWTDIEISESKHAENILYLILLIIQKPDSFILSHTLNDSYLNGLNKTLQRNLEKIKKLEITEEEALEMVLNIEKELIDKKYFKNFITKDKDFHNLIGEILITSYTIYRRLKKGKEILIALK